MGEAAFAGRARRALNLQADVQQAGRRECAGAGNDLAAPELADLNT